MRGTAWQRGDARRQQTATQRVFRRGNKHGRSPVSNTSMRGAAGLFSRRSFRTSTRALARNPKTPVRKSSPAYPIISFAVLGALSFGALAYITKTRDAENRTSTREKRTPIPNPLIPTPKKENQD